MEDCYKLKDQLGLDDLQIRENSPNIAGFGEGSDLVIIDTEPNGWFSEYKQKYTNCCYYNTYKLFNKNEIIFMITAGSLAFSFAYYKKYTKKTKALIVTAAVAAAWLSSYIYGNRPVYR